jgi:ABC-type polysaccharide/polyol phosphate export permease
MRRILAPLRYVRLAWKKRGMVYELTRRDFESHYSGTYLGIAWAFIHPLSFVFLLWLVFTLGLRSNPGGDVPFVIYLISGMIAWQFFSTALPSLATEIKVHGYLVKKGDFSLSLLHVARLLSSLVPHLALLVFSILICWLNGFPPGLHTLQLLYYLAAMFLLLLGLGWITSSTSLFVEDVANVVIVMMQFGFWVTPVIWNMKLIPQKHQWIVKLNPVCYIVRGYRDSLIYGEPFWNKPMETLYFWAFTAIALVAGVIIFRRLKPHFGEVI